MNVIKRVVKFLGSIWLSLLGVSVERFRVFRVILLACFCLLNGLVIDTCSGMDKFFAPAISSGPRGYVVDLSHLGTRKVSLTGSTRGEWWEANVDKDGKKIEVRSERIERETKENLKRFNEEMSKANVFQHKKLEGVFKNADNVKADAALKKEVFAVTPVGLKASTQDSPAVAAADPFGVQQQLAAIAKKNVAVGSELADATAEKTVPTKDLKISLNSLTDGLESVFTAEKNAILVLASHEDENNNHDESAREIRS